MKNNFRLTTFSLLFVTLLSSCIFKGPDDLTKAKVDFKISAIELFNEFESDEDTANEKYLNKILEVTGVITEISDKSVIIGEDMSLANCALSENELPKTNNLKVGQSVSIKGSCTGFNMFDVSLSKCVVVE